MSADNYVLVRKEKTHWVGYMQCASIEKANYDEQLFCTDMLEDAIILAQEQDTEYGYRFVIVGLVERYDPSPLVNEPYSPLKCKCCGGIQGI